ncbi:GGDEF domain-containing protein [Actinoplanes sp. NPDC051411]|uniref:GGDEF domain-containing protein n=1 Tax=Actinoplanes sp. NPDC051411 TaxID=3155522 RepID=UPI00342E88FF
MSRQVVHLLERAQAGDALEVRAVAIDLLAADPCAAHHFVNVVTYIAEADPSGSLAALEPMLAAAVREGSRGWQACALGTRAAERLKLGASDPAGYDIDASLRDLVAAERLTSGGSDPVAAVNAAVAIAIGWYELRLYELVEPQFRAAHAMSAADREQNGNCSMWLFNLAEMHLRWALELYQVGQVEAAESHTATAEKYALQAADEASGADAATWRDMALLAAACARADRHDPGGAARSISRLMPLLQDRGISPALLAYCRPFYGVALSRSGHSDEALAVMRQAVAELPPEADWLVTASTHRTYAVLLTKAGSPDARSTLAYGDALAATLWLQRQQTLHAAETIRDLEALRARHEQVARAADLDPLTGIANRRAFDRAVEEARGRATVLVIDTDKFKQINDTRGHAAGDDALRAIASALAAQAREEDLIARLGGDEFGALLPGVGSATGAEIARRMVRAVRELPDCPATVSIGVADGPALELRDTLIRADAAMYAVKRSGGDGVEVCASGTAARAA